DGGAVVAGRVGDVEAGQLADRCLVLEDRLQHALAHLRLVGRVGGQELAAREHGVHDGRHVVVVDAHAQEGELDAGVRVAGGQPLQQAGDLELGQRRLDVERPLDAYAGRHLLEQVVDGGDADRG